MSILTSLLLPVSKGGPGSGPHGGGFGWLNPKSGVFTGAKNDEQEHSDIAQRMGFRGTEEALKGGMIRVAPQRGNVIGYEYKPSDQTNQAVLNHMKNFDRDTEVMIDHYPGRAQGYTGPVQGFTGGVSSVRQKLYAAINKSDVEKSKLHIIHFSSNDDLPESVKSKVKDAVAQTLFRNSLNDHLSQGKSEMHAYIKAYRTLEDAGYKRGEDDVWNNDQAAIGATGVDTTLLKSTPTGTMTHVNRPMGSEEKDDPGTEDVDPPFDDMAEEPDYSVITSFGTNNDITKRISGSSPIGLNTKGEELADALGKRIAELGGLDVIWCSPLTRGIETAEPIIKYCDRTVFAKPNSALQPWHLGKYEGTNPSDKTHDEIKDLIEHPDQVPPGKGADGNPGETFEHAVVRQLAFYQARMNDFNEDPVLKIGIVVHSRSLELLKAWVDAGEDGKFDLDTDDLVDPDDEPHASVMRWHKGEISDIDLDDDDPLKPGIYLILHSLTADDTDDGNEELEKGGPGSGPQTSSGKKETFSDQLKALQELHDQLKNHSARSSSVPNEASANGFVKSVRDLGQRVDSFYKKNAGMFASRSNVISQKIREGHAAVSSAQRAHDQAKTWKADNALQNYHTALLGASKVAGSSWVGKVDVYYPPVEVNASARAAWANGASVLGITNHLQAGEGLPAESIREIAKHFEDVEKTSGYESENACNAWGGTYAYKWSFRVLKKIARDELNKWPEWTGVDLDGTLAKTTDEFDPEVIGEPNQSMVDKVKEALKEGKSVRIFTARVAKDPGYKIGNVIEDWCEEHIGQRLPVTNEKDPGMTELWDDRAHHPDELFKVDHNDSVMISFTIAPKIAEELKVKDGEDPRTFHVTLLYFGKKDTIDAGQLTKLETLLQNFTAYSSPIDCNISGPLRFPCTKQSNGEDVVVASVNGLHIQAFRQKLLELIENMGLEPRKNFGYQPHVTLKYIDPSDPMPIQRITPISVLFDSITLNIGDDFKTYTLRGVSKATGSKQGTWVTINGQHVLVGADSQPLAGNPRAFGRSVSSKVDTARKNAVLTGATEQRIADQVEAKLSKAIGVPRTPNNSAFDLRNDDVGIEVKTMITGNNSKITMGKVALGRKLAEAQAEGLKTFTVVADMRGNRTNARYYVSEKLGSLRLGSMKQVSLPQLKEMVRL